MRRSIPLLLVTMLVCCQTDPQEQSSTGKQLFSWEDIKAGNTRNLDKTAAKLILERDVVTDLEDAFFHHAELYETRNPFQDTVAKPECLEEIGATPISGKDDTLSVAVSIDYLECLGSAWANYSGFRKFRLDSFFSVRCPQFDFSGYDEWSLADFQREWQRGDLCRGSGEAQILKTAILEYEIRPDLTAETTPAAPTHNRHLYVYMTDAGEPCRVSLENDTATYKDCTFGFRVQKKASPQEGDGDDFFIGRLSAGQSSQALRFYFAGNMSLELNNWTGEVKFNDTRGDDSLIADQDNLPTYSLSADRDTLEGTIPFNTR